MKRCETKDKITVDELKLFLGYSLRFYDTHKDNTTCLYGVTSDGFELDYMGEFPIDHCGKTLKPIIKDLYLWGEIHKKKNDK